MHGYWYEIWNVVYAMLILYIGLGLVVEDKLTRNFPTGIPQL